MDPQLEELYGPLHRIKFNDLRVPILPSRSVVNPLKLQDSNLNPGVLNPSVVNPPPLVVPNPNIDLVVASHYSDIETALNEDCDFSDVVLKYINQVLMEEDGGEKLHTYHEPSVIEATEKSLYEALGQRYPPSGNQNQLPDVEHDGLATSSVRPRSGASSVRAYSGASGGSGLTGYSCSSDSSGRWVSNWKSNSDSQLSSAINASGLVDGPGDSPVSALSVSEIFNDSQSILQFQKGFEEANKFLPKSSLYVGFTDRASLSQKANNSAQDSLVNAEDVTRGKKHRYPEELQSEEGRINKQSAVSLAADEAVVRSEMFDRVLLCSRGKHDAALREALQTELNKNLQNAPVKGSNGGKGRGKKAGKKRDVVDLRSLLSLCAQAVASNDHRSANDLLRQIRQHSSPSGDGNQRMAHYFADGLEARLAGVGTPIYNCLVTGPASAVDILRAYHMFLATCPFKKMGNFFSNRTIMAVAENATCLHIIDLGMVYGFQWPCLIQRLSSRPGGPPKLRITGVDLPQPGFRPAKRVEETGRRLKNYAESFNVPFEFNAIAKKWETLTIEDLKINSDEVLVVNCMFRFKHIPEETVIVDCPRDTVLNLIGRINPAVFIQGTVNGAFNSPFFIARFREALFHFSTLFDMLEANLPRDIKERMLIEKEIFGRQAMNVIACEGLERIERPETYKQWQVRNERAGFRQLPLDRQTVEMAKKRVKSVYNKDFSIDEDGHWLLQGWKGRIVYALTTWKPAE
ncbi:hypothetical protein Cgig2_005706 [Carnegiea gigantea]|uniref:Uncharacterized protein n=1 Tax=Carnegiea gigantea TaxID=171969 RepID=A0A9Q1KHQ3_9CARY|nr:hypothetical protein Cgig2_005706 [Carnegiea gigantea]